MRILLAAALALGLCAQEKQTPPPGGPSKPFRVPPTEEFTLPNGLSVTLVPYGLIPKVTVELTLRGGAVTEPNGKDGVGGLTALLMKEGTDSRTAEQFAQDVARLGGSVDVTAGADEIVVTGDALSDYAAELVSILGDLALHPKLPESELARLKQDTIRNLSLSRANAPTIANEEFHRLVYGANGYGRILPSEASVNSLTAQDVKDYYAAHFCAGNAHLYIAGVFPGGLRGAIEKAFSAWPKGRPPQIPSIQAHAAHTLDLIDRPNSPQSSLAIGLPVAAVGGKDYIPLDVTDNLLGGSFMSRITSNIREQKGYTYSPRSRYEIRRGNGVWFESADVTTAVTGASLKEIFGEIDHLRKEPPPALELQGIQNGMAGLFVLSNSSRQGIIGQLRFVRLHGLPSDYLDTYVDKVMAVRPGDVQAMTEKYLDPAKMTVVVVGDKSKVADQVAPYIPK